MNRIILTALALWGCCATVSGQTAVTDTVYVYETVTVYDTVVIRDTVRINRASAMPVMHPRGDFSFFFTPPTATFIENGIILHESKNQKKVKTDKVMKLNTTGLAALILTAQSMAGLSAQETAPKGDLKKFPVQTSIVYPMTAQGSQTVNYHYNFSFNLFTGRVGAVTGVEFGSFLNRVERGMKGVQFSGLFNITQQASGVQFGGLGNASGVAKGVQVGGLGNITGDVAGVQFGGLGNIAESAVGIQFGGLVNISQSMTGLQFGGIVNLCERNRGAQIAGIANVTGESAGFQFAGISNVSGKVSGASFAGVFNRTGTLRGFQFGIVNVTDTVESGVSMAIVNIVKKGFYHEWELSFADYLNVGISYKAGTRKLYTIFAAGANFVEDKMWAAGIGFGNCTSLGRIDFQPEIVSYNYYPCNFRNIRATWSTHLKLGFVYKLNDRLGIAVAPGIYQFNGDMNGSGRAYKTSPIKELFSTKSNGKTLNTFGIGISVGLVLR